ncbi:MAG: AMP-binding protein [Proteobacteria bacterium]|nr:AMP-binding protein [Pseudomonadota bacterium]
MAQQFHLADLFETVAATVPDRLALVTEAGSRTFAELDARATRLASGLAARGIGRGDTVGLYLTNGPEHLEAFIAAIKLGAVPFNVNFRYGAEELHYLFSNAGAAVLIHEAEFAPVVEELRPRLPELKLTVTLGDAAGQSLAYEALAATPAAGPWPRDEQDIILTYTGGTTGMPKGVMWPHKAFVFACAGGAGYFNPLGPLEEPQDVASRAAQGYPLRLMPLAPLMHAAALWAVWSALLNGLTIVLDATPGLDPERAWDLVERLQVNIVQVVGDAMAIPLRDCLRDHPGRWNLSHVVNFGSGGAVFSGHVKADLAALLPANATITDGMGSSETGIAGAGAPSAEGVMRLPAGEHQTVVVGDRLAEAGETGLIARGGHIPVGYYGDPERSAEVFRTVGGKLWSVSGDAGRLDADGMITMFGRGSTSINSGGEKIFPEEVEEALRAHPAVQDAVVCGLPHPRWGEQVVALVSPRGPDRPDLAEVRAFLKGPLAAYKHPKALVWVDQVRRSPAGKQDYRWAKATAEAALAEAAAGA